MAVADSVGSMLSRVRNSPASARARMGVSVPRLALSGDHSVRAIGRAMRSVSLARLDPAERAWSRRIEARRQALLGQQTATGPAFDPGTQGPEGRFSMDRQRVSVGIASAFMSLQRAWCVLLMRVVRELAPSSCLELGAAFGISGAYQAAGLELNGAGRLTTLEGSPEWARIATRTFDNLGLAGRVDLRVGPIVDSLAALPAVAGPFDLVFIDAEHQTEATLQHFSTLLPRLAPHAVVVLDDVNWDPMREAWRRLAEHQRVSTAVPVGRLGFLVVAGAAAGSA